MAHNSLKMNNYNICTLLIILFKIGNIKLRIQRPRSNLYVHNICLCFIEHFNLIQFGIE